jgi:2-polyprenyl-3-methyl-5-hydroxy-6-metoxy-1,4-benzoquinol methylase
VFDVDGHVIGADDLVERVEKLIKRIDAAGYEPATTSGRREPPADEEELAAPLDPMRALHVDVIRPTEIAQAPGARGRAQNLAKRAVRKLTAWESEPRWTAQQNYDGHNIHFAAGVVAELTRIDRELEDLRRQNVRLRLQLVSSAEKLTRYRRQIERLLENVPSGADIETIKKQVERLTTVPYESAIDYAAFEERCRGSSEDLRQLQKHYLSFFPPPEGLGKVLDIGCGRGEMLETLLEAGYDAVGIDLDSGMVEVCRSRGLPAIHGDAIGYLASVPPQSFRGIFCAQVVEHLLTSELERMLRLSREKLMDSGVMVVETINPRSLYSLGNHFFADTSHTKPVHPETLRFMCEQVGFKSVLLEEESPHPIMKLLEDLPQDELGDVLRQLGTSVFGNQDYAIIATR